MDKIENYYYLSHREISRVLDQLIVHTLGALDALHARSSPSVSEQIFGTSKFDGHKLVLAMLRYEVRSDLEPPRVVGTMPASEAPTLKTGDGS